MGRDKARLRVAGEPLWERQVGVLRKAGAKRVMVVRRAGQSVLSGSIPHVRDRWPDAGPMAGLQAALEATTERWVAVLAVDMPGIEAEWFERLRGFCRPGCGAAVRHAEGSEPLAAIYPKEAWATVTRRLASGRLSMRDLVMALARGRRMKLVRVDAGEAASWRNWNTPDDRRSG